MVDLIGKDAVFTNLSSIQCLSAVSGCYCTILAYVFSIKCETVAFFNPHTDDFCHHFR